MKPWRTQKTIMEGVDDARTDVKAAAASVELAAAAGFVAFVFVSVAALVAISQMMKRG